MSTLWPKWLRAPAIVVSALTCGAMATPVLAQAPTYQPAPYQPGPYQSDFAYNSYAPAPMPPQESPMLAAPEPAPERVEPASDRTLEARWDNGFVAETKDKAFRIHLGGRMEFDNCWFDQDDNLLLGSSPDQTMLEQEKGTHLFIRSARAGGGHGARAPNLACRTGVECLLFFAPFFASELFD